MCPGIPPRITARLEKRLGRRFEFVRELGHGASGMVFEVVNRQLGRREALKVLTETPEADFLQRFAQEARVSAALDHPAIVKVYDYGHTGDLCWYSMQFVDGPSLGEILAVQGPLGESALVRLAVPLLDALQASHAQGVIHRDIKPANILLNRQGRPFLSDFGIAKTSDSIHKTRTGLLMGTPAYVSPEQALARPVDARSDLYSLGVTLYEAATGVLPFEGEASLQMVVLRLKEPPRPILDVCPHLEPAFAALIMKALEQDREARWTDAAAMRTALVAAAAAAGLDWTGPLEHLPDPNQIRTVLSGDNGTVVTLDGAWETLEEDPGSQRHVRRQIYWAIGALALSALLIPLGLRFRPREPRPSLPPPSPAPAQASAPGSAEVPPPPSPVPTPKVRPEPRPAPTPPPGRPVSPPYLESAPTLGPLAACVGLTVPLSLKVAEDGTVREAKVLAQVPSPCAQAAREAGLRYRFRPALDAQGRPVSGVVAIAIVFPEAP